jgi:hypothetical protein
MSAKEVGVLGVDGTLYPVNETVLINDGFPRKITFIKMS